MDNEQEHQSRRSNWSETVEDLVTAGDTDAAISLLQSVVSDLQTSQNTNPDPQLAAALTDLSGLYSSKGLSLKADDIAAKAFLLKQQAQRSCPTGYAKIVKEDPTSPPTVSLSSRYSVDEASVGTGNLDRTRDSLDNAVPCAASLDDDDWEAIADRPPNELLCLQSELDKPEQSVKEMKAQTPRRRGRGTFSYNKEELYSDKLSDSSTTDDTNEENASHMLEDRRELKSTQYGTQHVLVLADFPPSTKTIDLERLLGKFMNSGVIIRWVNDIVALAVFQTPSAALEVLNHVRCPFTLRQLDENDTLLSLIPPREMCVVIEYLSWLVFKAQHRKEAKKLLKSQNSLSSIPMPSKNLEPPKQRPKTSARTAQRLIAQGMGLKLPPSTTSFGSKELRKQEEDRRNRIVSRQKLRDEAWGDDDPKQSWSLNKEVMLTWKELHPKP